MTFKPTFEQEKELAAWRREGHGVWRATYVVVGFDRDFVVFMPGRLTEAFAVAAGRIQVAKATGESAGDVVFRSIERET